jgi:hypothetical protein
MKIIIALVLSLACMPCFASDYQAFCELTYTFPDGALKAENFEFQNLPSKINNVRVQNFILEIAGSVYPTLSILIYDIPNQTAVAGDISSNELAIAHASYQSKRGAEKIDVRCSVNSLVAVSEY